MATITPSDEKRSLHEEVAQLEIKSVSPPSSDADDDAVPYKMSWRTLAGFLVLSFAWACTTFAITGPTSSISNMIADYPGNESKAVWIADAGIFCIVTLPAMVGSFSDRYGKKWFIVLGCVGGCIGSVISGTAKDVDTIIGGQAITGVGSCCAIVTVAVGMEIVPSKYRGAAIAGMSIINGVLGAIGGVVIFAACLERGLGWRWGFNLQAIFFALGSLLVLALYNPPPTKFRRTQSFRDLLTTIDFIGIGLLATGSALLTIPLVWGGGIYAWNSAQVIPFFVVGPLVLVAFGIYEWKGRSDGLLHHGFFESLTFPILLVYGFVDGILLYGTSVFIPNILRALYVVRPLEVAVGFLPFNGSLLIGHLFWGFMMTKYKSFRTSLVISSALLTLTCGLLARLTPNDRAYFEGLLALAGFLVSATQVIPVAGLALVVPDHLMATSNLVLAIARGLGGALGIAVMTAIFNAKAKDSIPEQILPILMATPLPLSAYDSIIGVMINAPQAIFTIPDLPLELATAIYNASAIGAAEGFKNVWLGLMGACAFCLALSFFMTNVSHKMTDHVESALEPSKARAKQEHVA